MQRAVEYRTGVQAPADILWEVISDFETWSDWNPIHPRIEAALRIGTPVKVELVIEGAEPALIEAVVQDWVPYEQLHWRSQRMRGLITTIRYLEIEKMSDIGSTFSNGELFMGPLVRFVSRDERRRLRAAYTRMGEAVKARAEAIWSERLKNPT